MKYQLCHKSAVPALLSCTEHTDRARCARKHTILHRKWACFSIFVLSNVHATYMHMRPLISEVSTETPFGYSYRNSSYSNPSQIVNSHCPTPEGVFFPLCTIITAPAPHYYSHDSCLQTRLRACSAGNVYHHPAAAAAAPSLTHSLTHSITHSFSSSLSSLLTIE